LTPETGETGVESTSTQPTAVVQIPVSGEESTVTPASPGSLTNGTAPAVKPTDTINPSPRCARATSEFLEAIRDGISDIDLNYTVETGWAVQSNEAEELWFVAAKVYGDDIEPEGTLPGVWGLATGPDGSIDVYAINELAKDYSFTLWGEDSDPVLTMVSDGAQDAYNCALIRN
jgi:hypothetical protein